MVDPVVSVANSQARPFLKWAGGKGQLLPELLARLPPKYDRYIEPFVGAGALFFAQASSHDTPVTLSDANSRLIDAYRAVRDDVEEVIAQLQNFRNDHDLFYEVRSWQHENLSPPMQAARIIFLNRTCFNGLYRENRRGEFNVPFGRYQNPKICDSDNLRAVSAVLQESCLQCLDFEPAAESAGEGDFVYLDPPYHPISRTSSFTAYQGNGFGAEEQERLAAVYAELDNRGVLIMLSNSDTPLIQSLYKNFLVELVAAARVINSRTDRRGKITELVIRNYGRALRSDETGKG